MRRRPATADTSVMTPLKLGVKPPGAISWKLKQFGSANTCASAAWSGRLAVMGTAGQPAEPSRTPSRASSTSPTSSVAPLSRLKMLARVLGLRK